MGETIVKERPMGNMPVTPLLVLASLLAFSGTAAAFECKVCHSKNPAMVRMHQATQARDIGCFDCHKIGEKLMGKSQPKDRDSLLRRRASDPVCIPCHRP
jgi:formate-dependent nitrite reductase cytochrome c552 subunit